MASENENLERKLDSLIRLTSISLVYGKPQHEQIRLLSIAGLGPKEIAELIGTTPNTVNVALSTFRKRGKLNLKSEGAKEND